MRREERSGVLSEEPTNPYATGNGARTTPPGWGDAPLPKRNGHRGMVPSTWLGRSVKLEYTDAHGLGVETSGILLDWCPVGLVVSLGGAKTLLSFDRLALMELVND